MTTAALLAIRRQLSSMLESIDVIDRNLHQMEKEIKPTMIKKTVLLAGDCNVGKTSFIEKIKRNQMCYKYIATDCISSYDIEDKDRNIFYTIYDMSGDSKAENPSDMFHWFYDVVQIYEGLPPQGGRRKTTKRRNTRRKTIRKRKTRKTKRRSKK